MLKRKRLSARGRIERHCQPGEMNKQLRGKPSKLYSERKIPPRFEAFASDKLLPLLTLTGRKLPEQRRLAIQCLYNVVLVGLVDGCVGDSRSTNKPGVRLRVRVWDSMVDAEFVVLQRGSQSSGMQTRYFATPQLLNYFWQWPLEHLINIELHRNTTTPDKTTWEALVVLQAGKDNGGKVLPMLDEELDATVGVISVGAYLESVEDDIEFINRVNLRYSWAAYKKLDNGCQRVFQPNVCLKQVHSKKLLRYARLYTWDAASAQILSKSERRLIRIDREPVMEFDYAALHIRMLYHLEGIDPSHEFDIYYPERVLETPQEDRDTSSIVRRFVKRATNILLNTTTRRQAIGAVQNLLRGDAEGRELAALLRCNNISAADVVNRIINVHTKVSHRFFTDIGAMLQTIDGMVMRRILKAFAIEDRPALGIHDSVLCRTSDAEFAVSMMKIHYHTLFGFFPVIHQVY